LEAGVILQQIECSRAWGAQVRGAVPVDDHTLLCASGLVWAITIPEWYHVCSRNVGEMLRRLCTM
jgi:hypothetical protein